MSRALVGQADQVTVRPDQLTPTQSHASEEVVMVSRALVGLADQVTVRPDQVTPTQPHTSEEVVMVSRAMAQNSHTNFS